MEEDDRVRRDDIPLQAAEYSRKHRSRRRWYKLVTCLAAVVVFCTVYALILPAVTMEGTACGLEEHTHTDACYAPVTETTARQPVCSGESLGLHTHSPACYDETGAPVCGYADFVVHTHTENCYNDDGTLWCPLPEIPAHTHTPACYDGDGHLVCGVEEIVLHTHTAECYNEDNTLVCGLVEVQEHTHTEACFADMTLPVDGEALTCTLPEDENHTHTARCYGQWELVCETPEHTHTAACYADATADVETTAAWEKTFADTGMTGEWPVDVLAIAQTQLGYKESRRNYTVAQDGETLLGYTRYGQWYGEPYGTWDGMFVSFCLHYAGVEDMPLEADSARWVEVLSREEYDLYRPAADHVPTPGELIFLDTDNDDLADRVGLVAEWIAAAQQTPAQIKTIQGDAENEVRYVTLDADDETILGYGLLPEQTFYCGLPGHVHGKACLGDDGEPLCGLEEHTHTEHCALSPETFTQLSFVGPDYTIQVRYGKDAALPEGVTLAVEEIPANSEEYEQYYRQSVEAVDAEKTQGTVVFARFFDIQFLLGEEKLEPAAPVEVTITYAETVETGDGASCRTVHFGPEGTELLDVTAEEGEDGSTSFTHTQNGFSVVGNVVTMAMNANAADVGPDALPVDYYVCIDGVWTCVGTTKTGWYGDYNAAALTNYNRDYITVEQAVSVLGPYGFTGNEANCSRITAYQQKSGNTNIYSDTETVVVPENAENGQKILPLSRNGDHAGYNLYYLPNNSSTIGGVASPEKLDKSANGFYSVKVYDAQGVLMTAAIIKTGGSFSYDAANSGVTNWLVAYSGGTTGAINGSSIAIENITSTVVVSPQRQMTDNTASHSVTFKVMVDGQWRTVGTLPYYYSGTVNGSQRAYITSDMAAQFFGDYGYAAGMDPGAHFGYSYNDIYTIRYSTNSGFCMDITGGKIVEGTYIQLYGSNSSDAQIFRIWDAGNGYSFITPVTNSSLHINIPSANMTDGQQLWLHTAADAASQWKVIAGDNGTVSFQSAKNTAFYIDLNSGDAVKQGKIQIWNNGSNRYWKLDQLYRISNDTVSAQNGDGTWNIGLTPESNGDIVCYYLPGETAAAYTNVAESAVSTVNSFWSVKVRDDMHAVYSEGELDNMVQLATHGGEATVTVQNAEGILWSVAGAQDVTTSQSGGYTTFVIRNITQPVEVTATEADPSFTVQYYANIDRYVMSSTGNLALIDTSGGKLPQNTQDQALLWLTLEDTGTATNQNAGNATVLNRVKTEKQLTQMYTDGTYNFEQYPGLAYFDKLWGQENYVLDAVLVLKDGKSPDSTNDDDWWWYQINQSTWNNITFTNLASEENAPRQEGVKQGRDGTYRILLQEGTVLRLRYETGNQDYNNQANFYDYDITSGQNTNGTWRSGITGINQASNYQSNKAGFKFSGTHDAGAAANTFAFGNANCETGLGLAQWKGNNINAYNGTKVTLSDNSTPFFGNSVYRGCTFGLVTGLNSSGDLIWDSQITAPHLFDDGPASGKHTYNGGSLQFMQTGDTYTLTAADSSVGSRSRLEYFFNPSPSSSTTHSHIFTNNFWPMDAATSKTDPLMGAINASGTCDVKVNGFWDEKDTVGGAHNGVRVPISDDGRAHNWFFGMNFSLSFTLTEDYTGPLEYIFFGDDDLWVFLDGKLICDIGGVHSSVGEYVNLWDHLSAGDSGHHTLSFFYTERGASGSTCWMSFTLPSVTSATTGKDIGSLQIEKKLENTGNTDYSNVEYQFKVELLTTENGTPLSQTFGYSRSDGTYGTVKSGGTVAVKQNETVTISGIPAGTFYRVTELSNGGYHVKVNGNEGYIVSGTIANGAVEPAQFVNEPYYALPSTGGAGTQWYTFGGLTLIAGALLYSILHRRREAAK